MTELVYFSRDCICFQVRCEAAPVQSTFWIEAKRLTINGGMRVCTINALLKRFKSVGVWVSRQMLFAHLTKNSFFFFCSETFLITTSSQSSP